MSQSSPVLNNNLLRSSQSYIDENSSITTTENQLNSQSIQSIHHLEGGDGGGSSRHEPVRIDSRPVEEDGAQPSLQAVPRLATESMMPVYHDREREALENVGVQASIASQHGVLGSSQGSAPFPHLHTMNARSQALSIPGPHQSQNQILALAHSHASQQYHPGSPPTPDASSLSLSSIDTLRPSPSPFYAIPNPNHSYFQASTHPLGGNVATSTPQTTLDEERWRELRSPTTGMIVPEELSAGMVEDSEDADGIEETVARVAMEEQRERAAREIEIQLEIESEREHDRAHQQQRRSRRRMVSFEDAAQPSHTAASSPHHRHGTPPHEHSQDHSIERGASSLPEFIPDSHSTASPLRPADAGPDPDPVRVGDLHRVRRSTHAASVHFTLPNESSRSPSPEPVGEHSHGTPRTGAIDIVASSTLDERFPHLPAWPEYTMDEDGQMHISTRTRRSTQTTGTADLELPSQDVDVEIMGSNVTATRELTIPSPASSPVISPWQAVGIPAERRSREAGVPTGDSVASVATALRTPDEPTSSVLIEPVSATTQFLRITGPPTPSIGPVSSSLNEWREAESDAVRTGDQSNRERVVMTFNLNDSSSDSSPSSSASDTEDEPSHGYDADDPDDDDDDERNFPPTILTYYPPPPPPNVTGTRTRRSEFSRHTIGPNTDFQGILWDIRSVDRVRLRDARVRNFGNYENRPLAYKEQKESIKKELKKVQRLGDFSPVGVISTDGRGPGVNEGRGWFEWNRTNSARVKIKHFQLRHLTARIGGAGLGGALLFTSGNAGKVSMWRERVTSFIDVESVGKKNQASRGIPLAFRTMRITTLAARRDVMIAGGWSGEFVVKGLTNRTMEELEMEEKGDCEEAEAMQLSAEEIDCEDLEVSGDHGDPEQPRRPFRRRRPGRPNTTPEFPGLRSQPSQQAPYVVSPPRRRYSSAKYQEGWGSVVGRCRDFSILTHLSSLRGRPPGSLWARQSKLHSPSSRHDVSELEHTEDDIELPSWTQRVDNRDEEWLRYLKSQRKSSLFKCSTTQQSRWSIHESPTANHGTVVKYASAADSTTCGRINYRENAITTHIVLTNMPSGCTSAIISSNDKKARVMDVNTCRIVQAWAMDWPVNCTAWNASKRILAVVGDSPETHLIDSVGGGVVAKLHGHIDFSFACAFAPDGYTLATGNQDMTTRLYDLRNPSKSHTTLGAKIDAIRSLHFSPCGTFLSMAEAQDFVHVFNAREGYEQAQVIDFFGNVAGVSWSQDDAVGGQGLWVANGEDDLTCVMEWQRVNRGGASAVEGLLV